MTKFKARDFVLYLSQGFFNNKPTWHYLEVKKLQMPILLKDARDKDIDLANYGKIVFSGFGEQPPESVRKFVQQKYGNAA